MIVSRVFESRQRKRKNISIVLSSHIVVTSFISLVATFFLSFYRKSPRTHYAAPPLPKKLTLFGGPHYLVNKLDFRLFSFSQGFIKLYKNHRNSC